MFLFLAKSASKNVFDVIWESKKRFKTIKNRNLKKSKNQDFSKGVLYFVQNRPGKCVWRCSGKKKGVFTLQNHKVKKVESLVFFQRG